MAEQFNVTSSAVSLWETGKNKPSSDTIIEIAEYFNVSIQYLFGLEVNDDKLQQVKTILIELGIMKPNDDDLTKEGLTKAFQLLELMKK